MFRDVRENVSSKVRKEGKSERSRKKEVELLRGGYFLLSWRKKKSAYCVRVVLEGKVLSNQMF